MMFRSAAVLTIALWLGAFFFPLLAVFSRVLAADGSVSELLFSPSVLQTVRSTLLQALTSTVVSVLLGIPLGLAIGRSAVRGDRWARRALPLLAIPYGVPTLAVAMTGILLFGRSGWLAGWGISTELAYSMSGVVFLHALLNIPWVALLVAQSRLTIPRSWEEAASTLGAGRVGRFRRVIWPWVSSTTISTALQVFQLCATSFALVLLFGGGPPVETIETALVGAVKGGSLDWARASALGCWQVVLTAVPWAWLAWREARDQARGRVGEGQFIAPKAVSRGRPQSGFVFFAIAALFVLPYGIFLLETPLASALGVASTPEFQRAALNSFALAASSSVFALSWAGAAVWVLISVSRKNPRWAAVLRTLALLPSGVSILVTGLGFWFAYSAWVDPFEGSFLAMSALQATAVAPWLFRILWPSALGIPRRQLEAARTLGASPSLAFWRIDARRWRAPVLTAAAIAFAAALGEVAAYSLFGAEGSEPLPLLAARWMGRYRFEDEQAVTAWILLGSGGLLGGVLAWSYRVRH